MAATATASRPRIPRTSRRRRVSSPRNEIGLSVYLPPETYDRLVELATEEGRSMSRQVVRMIDDWFRRRIAG